MAWLLFGVGLNLSGVFQIGGGWGGAGSSLASRGGHLGSFFTGLLAVLVATPCTAPFMGVAVAAGLAAPPAITELVFLVMGLGLAAPYVLLAALPSLARAAPRPGRWMEMSEAGAGLPDVRRGRLAALGGQPGSRPVRRSRHRRGFRAAGFCRLGAGDQPGRVHSQPPARPVCRGRHHAGRAGGAERHCGRTRHAGRGSAMQVPKPSPPPAWLRCAPRAGRFLSI